MKSPGRRTSRVKSPGRVGDFSQGPGDLEGPRTPPADPLQTALGSMLCQKYGPDRCESQTSEGVPDGLHNLGSGCSPGVCLRSIAFWYGIQLSMLRRWARTTLLLPERWIFQRQRFYKLNLTTFWQGPAAVPSHPFSVGKSRGYQHIDCDGANTYEEILKFQDDAILGCAVGGGAAVGEPSGSGGPHPRQPTTAEIAKQLNPLCRSQKAEAQEHG